MRRILLAPAVLFLAALFAAGAAAQDPVVTFPANYRQIFSNDEISVLHVHYGPHEKLGLHNHSNYPTIYVYLSDSGPVRYSHDEEIPAFVVTRPALKAGSIRVSPGRIERHTVENLGDQPSDYLRIELKHIPLHSTLHPQRIPAPATLAPGNKEVFASPELTIHRILCRAGATCPATSHQEGTLLIAFSPSVVTTPLDDTGIHLQPGDVHWLQHPQSLSVRASTEAPAHLLQIELHPPK